MRSKKSASKMAVALGHAKMQASDLHEKLGPAVGDAKDRIAPVVADAREKLAPAVADAKERIAPVVDDARGRLADLAENVATRLDDSLPDKATPKAVKKASANSSGGSKLRKLLLMAGLGGVVAVVVKKLRGGSEPQWQSTVPGRPMPAPTASTPPEPAASVGGLIAGEETAPDPLANDAAGGGTPDEAAADALEEPHAPTTPDHPADQVDVDKG